MKKSVLDIEDRDNGSPEKSFDEDRDTALDKAKVEVLSGLSDKKKKSQKEKQWGDRPEHLRKGLGEMNDVEKRDYYLWKAGEFGVEKKIEVMAPAPEPRKIYTKNEVQRVGKMFLRFIARRMPVKKEVDQEEIETFGEVFTPLANKYMGGIGYADEIAGGVFLLSFLGARLGKPDETSE